MDTRTDPPTDDRPDDDDDSLDSDDKALDDACLGEDGHPLPLGPEIRDGHGPNRHHGFGPRTPGI